MTCTTEMPGLQAGPMGAWLAAIGVLRMTARTDPSARLRWDGTTPVLTGQAYEPAFEIADHAAFSPVITPWQSGGGWGAKDKAPAARLAALRNSRTPRLAAVRATIAAADAVIAAHPGAGKDEVVRRLRNTAPPEAIPWIDVAVPLYRATSGVIETRWAPLAGSGGNDGRWDLSTTCHEAILSLAPGTAELPGGGVSDDMARRRGLASDLLYGTEHQALAEMSSGPYWPRHTESGLANPWAIILLAEGLCAFGDARVREWASQAQPWTTPPGPELGREPSWGEAWLPLWDGPVSMGELAVVLGGPQPRWHSQSPAATPAQMIASLRAGKWPAGITGYARYGLAQRRGRSHAAVPLGVLTPQALPDPEWLDADEAAARAGVAPATWRGYVSRGQAPGPGRRNPVSGRMEWDAWAVGAWQSARPGPGIRTDLG